MLLVFVVLGVLVIVGIVVLVVGRADGLEPDQASRGLTGADADLGSPDSLDAVRFPVVLRGYRMDDVDTVLERLSRELAERDAEIERLRSGGPGTSTTTTSSGLPRRSVQSSRDLDVFGRPLPPEETPPA